MGTNNMNSRKLASFVLVSALLALVIGLLVYILPKLGFPVTSLEMVIVVSFLVILFTSFAVNLILPIANDKYMRILMPISSICVIFYFYQMRFFITNLNPQGKLDNFWDVIQASCFCGPLLELIIYGIIVLFGWLGATVNMKLLHKHGKGL